MVLVIVLTCIVVPLCMAALVATALKKRWKIFGGPALDAWLRVRRQLSRGDRLAVQRATMKGQPVNRAALAPAQLTYSRLVQYMAEHSPLRRRPIRRTLGIIYGVLGVGWLAVGIIDPHGRAINLIDGVLALGLAVLWVTFLPRSMAGKPARMIQLRRQVMERYPRAY